MATKRKHPNASKQELTAAKKRKIGNRAQTGSGTVETTSGAERSSLDPKRKAISLPDENRVPISSGQLSGDVQSLSQQDLDDSESVEELVAEGQDLEGELVKGVEDAPLADQGDIRTHASPDPETQTPEYKNRNRL
jgi:hypothetical protein